MLLNVLLVGIIVAIVVANLRTDSPHATKAPRRGTPIANFIDLVRQAIDGQPVATAAAPDRVLSVDPRAATLPLGNHSARTQALTVCELTSVEHNIDINLTGETGPVLLGRDRSATVRFDDNTVSSFHARLIPDGTQWTITDLGSTNGTYVNGQPVTVASLTNGDRIQLAKSGPVLLFTRLSSDLPVRHHR